MNGNRIEGKWKTLRGTIKSKLGKLTDDDLDIVNGRLEKLAGGVQKADGMSAVEAERLVHEWTRLLDGRALTGTGESKQDRGSRGGEPQ